MNPINSLEKFFSTFRTNMVGYKQCFNSPFGEKEIIYADWTASGRSYQPIEECIQKEIMPFLANTHTETTVTGTLMSKAYEKAKAIVKNHVGVDVNDVLIFCDSGMTGAVNKLQRILGLRIHEKTVDYLKPNSFHVDELLRPIVFVTHMEHHSNHISWLETIATVEIINANIYGNVDLNHLKYLIEKYKNRKNKIAAVTACSNVTGIETPYHEIAKIMHQNGGLCFVDFACSAPYININMHPDEEGTHLDAIYFSPHKFLGGPGASGVLIFSKNIYKNCIPDHPGGGTVVYTNPWKMRNYTSDIQQREDGGTPPLLQGIKAAMCIRLKENMGVENILNREKEILEIIFKRLLKIKNIEILEGKYKKRLGIISFIITGAHYNLIVKILNDRFGIQTRGGCSCAGSYGHHLLHVNKVTSLNIQKAIQSGNMLDKPGWIRLSIHPIMTTKEINYILDAIEFTANRHKVLANDYVYNADSNEYIFKNFNGNEEGLVKNWLDVAYWSQNASLTIDSIC